MLRRHSAPGTRRGLVALAVWVLCPALAVVLVGTLMAASTGIIGATVVTLGLMALPNLLKQGYHPALATGAVCTTGTLGQIVPPSIALVLLAGLNRALASPKGDIFMGVCEHF